MLLREEYQIIITPHQNGAAVQFAKDRTLIDSLKARFPQARWGKGTQSWHVPGKLAGHRLQLWADEQQPYLRALEQRARDAEWDAPPLTAPAPRAERIAADADPFDLDWSDWRNLGTPDMLDRRRYPLYHCLLRREVFELGKHPGFALRLPQTGQMVRLMHPLDPVRLPVTPMYRNGPTARHMYERLHWYFLPVSRWQAVRGTLPAIKKAITHHDTRRI